MLTRYAGNGVSLTGIRPRHAVSPADCDNWLRQVLWPNPKVGIARRGWSNDTLDEPIRETSRKEHVRPTDRPARDHYFWLLWDGLHTADHVACHDRVRSFLRSGWSAHWNPRCLTVGDAIHAVWCRCSREPPSISTKDMVRCFHRSTTGVSSPPIGAALLS